MDDIYKYNEKPIYGYTSNTIKTSDNVKKLKENGVVKIKNKKGFRNGKNTINFQWN